MGLKEQIEARKRLEAEGSEVKHPPIKERGMVVKWPEDCRKAINRRQVEIEEQTGERVLKSVAAIRLMQELLKKK